MVTSLQNIAQTYDALLIVSFGGPEGMADVMPFLQNVVRGRNIPHERLSEVAHHYELFGGISPINGQNRALIAALRRELDAHDLTNLPIYWGNRNWAPYLTETLSRMKSDGIGRALALVTSAYSSYSGCRQYREDIQRAQAEVGDGAPIVDKVRVFYNHPLFIEANAHNLVTALADIPPERRAAVHVSFTAHSIPLAAAQKSDYAAQLEETARLVAEAAHVRDWALVFQSRSGPPQQPWLEPDILDHLPSVAQRGVTDVVALPIGFVSDHLEVLFDLDTEAAQVASKLGMGWHRAPTVNLNPAYIQMIRLLIEERLTAAPHRLAIGRRGPNHDVCPIDCCLAR